MNPIVSESNVYFRKGTRQQGSSYLPHDERLPHSASLLRTPENFHSVRNPVKEAASSYVGGPMLDFLRSQNDRNSPTSSSNSLSRVSSIGELPVGATIPLANLESSGPGSSAKYKDREDSSNSIAEPAARGKPIDYISNHDAGSEGPAVNGPLLLWRGLIWRPVSPEFLNFVLALLFYAIRYPSVFWSSNKAFSLLFSLQMAATGLHCVLLSCAFSILYKLHMMGGVLELHGTDDLLLSLPVTVVLFVLTMFVLVLSCAAVYAHGYHKFVQFVCRSRQKYHISYQEEPAPIGPYTGHIAGLTVLVLQCVTCGPLIWDMSRVYRGSLDYITLITVISTIAHIFAWIALWLIFTVKNKWVFKLRVTVARACVSSSRSIKLVNDVELLQAKPRDERHGDAEAPLLVVGRGRAFVVPQGDHKRSIMSVVHQSQSAQAAGDSNIYWHRPDPPTLSPRPTRTPAAGGSGSNPRKQQAGSPLSESEDDAGDYALLLEEGGIKSGGAGPTKQTRRLSRGPSDARYVDRKQILAYRRQNEEQQQQEHQQEDLGSAGGDEDMMPPLPPPPPGLGGPSHEGNDSKVHDDVAIHRSDSASTTTSSTATNHQPDQSTSSTNTATNQSEPDGRNRCGSDDDLTQLPADPSNFPSYPRPLRAQSLGGGGAALYADSTVVIRRQRALTRDLQPPVDPIYGSRSHTSFKEETLYGTRGGVESIKEEEDDKDEMCSADLVARAQNAANSQQYGNSSSGSVGYHTASNSSGSSSPIPPPSSAPGLATPPPPMAPLYPSHGTYGHSGRSPHHSIYGQTTAQPHSLYGQTSMHHNIYGRTAQNKLPQAPQIPLPPIPQGSIPGNLRYGANPNSCDDGHFPPPPLSSPSPLSPPPGDLYPTSSLANSRFAGGGMGGGGGRAVVVGRSSSLRFTPGTPPRHFTNSLPHVLPRNSHYNTGV
ncbi:uncharacterized protein LOC108667916 [Hyalella azteca]|uniref:Uncharacterized protein LOC108667916 n=1 Tax=Hyalella azteca TaxID=294128 RepID=A0A8B7NA97_HYAAZ|nr:uncharacterized protein LOC108667916 [Hyalella azteca]